MLEYFSRIILCSGTRINWPRTKYTPSWIAAEDPKSVPFAVKIVAELLPALIELIATSEARLSPFTNSTVEFATEAPVVPVELAVVVAVVKYFT